MDFFIIFQIDDSTADKLSKMENNLIKTIYFMNEIFMTNLLKNLRRYGSYPRN